MESIIDFKTKYDRIGYSIVFKKVARAVVFVGFSVMFLLMFATVLTNNAVASIRAEQVIKDIRYQNIRHK